MQNPHMSSPAQAMVLAAGRGERMRPLTDTTPKPLLEVQGKPLMQWTLETLARGGVTKVLVNTAWLGEQIPTRFGTRLAPQDGHPIELLYSHEGNDFGGALETAGGIVRALPRLAPVFWVAAGDVFAPRFDFAQEAMTRFANSGRLAHLWLVPNPAHHSRGDFGIATDGSALIDSPRRFTFSTIALYRSELFASPHCDIGAGNPMGIRAALGPLLREAIRGGHVSAEVYEGPWTDVGTPQRLAQLRTEERPA